MALWSTATRDIVAGRWVPCVRTWEFRGVDLTGATFKLQVRDRKDGGTIRADLSTVTLDVEGVRLIDVETVDGEPRSTIGIRINEATMEAMAVALEAGLDGQIWFDLHVTPSGGDKFVGVEGRFTVKAGATN